ncbi:efflux RND transporter periplasmic adaptor subunit [uncultured Methylobacterium sp.]|uniref:efflux RND transporter periplasmic adaptor subunit n=1 Tax=uncultured Methylobacterium sp. TaxID=157278 RepID=UPI0035CC6BBC
MLSAVIGPAAAESTPEGTSVLGVRAGSACLRETVRVTGFALPREESGASLPFDGYRITEILAGEGDTVTSGQELLKAVRQPDASAAQRPPGLETVSVRAPIAGRITRLSARIGAVTGAGPAPPPGPGGMPEPMVRIMGEAGIDLLIDVPSPYAAKIRMGASARVVPDDGPEIRGTVRVAVSEVDPKTQLGRARLTLDPPTALRPGQFASAVIETARDCGLSVPRSAVSYPNGVPTVQVLNGTAVETRSIRTGLIDESNVQVREGLSDGEPVVADTGTALRAGDRVTPVISGPVISGKAGTAR